MIEIRNITKSFGSLQVLKGIDLHINKGEVVSIVGPSGAGKTTLLQIMGTLDDADSGSVIIGGTDVTRLNAKELARFRNQHLGFVFQFHRLLPEFTALENVMIPAMIANSNKCTKFKNSKEIKTRALELLDYLGLKERAGHKPSELSGGEKQRVAVARALINDPEVILADEPSGSLDSQNKAELHQLFFDLRDKFGQTFVIVTHDEHLSEITDRTIRIIDGRIVDDGKVSDTTASDTIASDAIATASDSSASATIASDASVSATDSNLDSSVNENIINHVSGEQSADTNNPESNE